MFARIEHHLLDHGHVESAVKVQTIAKIFEIFYRRQGPQKKWIEQQMKNEFEMMEDVQCESGDIQGRLEIEESQKFNADLTEEMREEAREGIAHYKELEPKYENRWWYRNREYHSHLFNKPKGSYIREFDLYQNGYLSHTQEEVQRACRAMGGCCAYDCGCCYRDRLSSRISGNSMHCRSGCICCERRRDPHAIIDISDSEMDSRARDIIIHDYCSHVNLRKRL